MQQFEPDRIIGGQYKLLGKIGRGSFGEVHKGQNIDTGDYVAVKLVKNLNFYVLTIQESQDAIMPQLKHEYQLLNQLQGPGIPKIYWFGQFEDKTVMVMELLGYNLEQLFNLVNRRFELKTMLMLIDQMMDIISLIHGRGYLYRDVKPENLLMGVQKRFDTIYIIDFGLSKRYKDKKTGEHIGYKENKGLVGTARYVSLNTHLGIEQSRRDDMESLLYLWLYCLKGALPWQGLDVTTREEKYELIKTIKQSISIEDLCIGLPVEFSKYFQHIRSLRFDEEPDYKKMKMMFRDLFFKLDYVWDYQFEWLGAINSANVEIRQQSKNSLSSIRGGSKSSNIGQILKTDEEEDIQEKIEFKIQPKNQKLDLTQLKVQPNLFQNIFK